ncbi:MAG: two-component system response regulator ArlR [Arcticibacterium sp.]|jgi:DNA-binding response OmpR family regulator
MQILIVEDEIGIANFLEQGLSEEGYTVTVSHNGQEGLELAIEKNFDILLLDWNLPENSGLEICERLREKGFNSPIIFLTARDTTEDLIKGLQAGANDYIKKPFHFSELLERIKVQLRTKEPSKTLVLANLEIKLASHQTFVDGCEVNLTQKEFELLCYLVTNQAVVCSRTKIIEDVWNIHFDYDTGVIDVYINALRKKLKGSAGLIKTVRGVGYIAKEE